MKPEVTRQETKWHEDVAEVGPGVEQLATEVGLVAAEDEGTPMDMLTSGLQTEASVRDADTNIKMVSVQQRVSNAGNATKRDIFAECA